MDRLGDKVCCNPTVKLKKGEYYPLIDIEKIAPGYKTVRNQEEIVFNGQSCTKFEDRDVLFARITPCLENGKIAMADTNGKCGIGSTELFVFRGIEGISNTDYVYYLLRMNHIRQLAANSMTGASGRQRADLNFIKKIKWQFPVIEQQQKIASILTVYDNLIENNNKRIKLLEQMAENLYKEWFVRFRFPNYQNTEFENGIPKGWKVVKIKKCVKRLAFNRLYKENELEKEGNVIVIDQSANEYLGFHNNEPSHYANYETPIILFGDHTCKFKLMCKDFSLGENVVPFCSCDTKFADTYFLYYAVHKIITTEEYKRHWRRFVTLKILVPLIELQRKYSKLVVWFEKEKEVLFKHNLNLIKQRDMLLPRLMSGKLEVK